MLEQAALRRSKMPMIILGAAMTLLMTAESRADSKEKVTKEEARDIGIEAVVYGYPMVIVDVTKRVQTNVAEPQHDGHAPINQFSNFLKYPRPLTRMSFG